jgi:hypothetical protein
MGVIAHQRPGIDRRAGFLGQRAQSSHECLSILLIIENPPLIDSTNDHMVQRPRAIQSRLSRHEMTFQ